MRDRSVAYIQFFQMCLVILILHLIWLYLNVIVFEIVRILKYGDNETFH
jgi:hypothetical protein